MMKRTDLGDHTVLSRRTLLCAAAGMALTASHPARAKSSVPHMSGYVGDYFSFDLPQNMPPIAFAGADNAYHNLKDFSGKVVLLNFWATWCAPCLAELPDLDRLQSVFPKDQFIILALCEDARNLGIIESYYKRRRVETLGRYMDPMGQALKAYAVPAVPTSFILDRTGRVRGILPGAAPWDSPEGRALVAYYLDERRSNTG